MGEKKKKIIIVMPAYNADKTLRDTLKEIPKGLAHKIILVDDASHDKTVAIANRLGLTVFTHFANLGYGGNQKTCYWEALKEEPDVIIMLHPDYQYDAKLLPKLIQPIIEGEYDIMIGSRIRTRREALEGGMPPIKYILNRVISTIENVVLGINLSEHFSGLRAYSAHAMQKIPFQKFSDDFVFDQQFLMSAVSLGLRVGETPVPVRYFNKSSSIGFKKGVKYIIETFWHLFLYASK